MKKKPVAEEEVQDLGIIIGTKEEKLWQDIKEKTQGYIESIEKELIVQRAVLELAEQKIKEQQCM